MGSLKDTMDETADFVVFLGWLITDTAYKIAYIPVIAAGLALKYYKFKKSQYKVKKAMNNRKAH